MSEYRAGSPKPDGYVARSLWAEAQLAAGLRQRPCAMCGLWKFPQEMGKRSMRGDATMIDGGRLVAVKTEQPVCIECEAKP